MYDEQALSTQFWYPSRNDGAVAELTFDLDFASKQGNALLHAGNA